MGDYNNDIGYFKDVEREEYDCPNRISIEFSPRTYDYFELSDYIEEKLIINGDLQPDEKSPISIDLKNIIYRNEKEIY